MTKPYVYHRADDLGIPVVDGKDRIFVGVTQSDIVNAKKADSKHCALARAALRLPNVHAAYFFRTCAFLEYANRMVKFELRSSRTKERHAGAARVRSPNAEDERWRSQREGASSGASE